LRRGRGKKGPGNDHQKRTFLVGPETHRCRRMGKKAVPHMPDSREKRGPPPAEKTKGGGKEEKGKIGGGGEKGEGNLLLISHFGAFLSKGKSFITRSLLYQERKKKTTYIINQEISRGGGRRRPLTFLSRGKKKKKSL